MEMKRSEVLLWATLLTQILFIHALSTATFGDDKHYYKTPHAPSTPKVSVGPAGKPPSPAVGGGGYYHSPPASTPPIILKPPVIPTPTIPITHPTPPFPFHPISHPFTCIYWKNHPNLVWGLVGWWTTIANAFGISKFPGIASNANVLQALSNTRTDGYGKLYREGTAALLNAMAHKRFPYTVNQVKQSFVSALVSEKAADAQAKIFKMANEG